MIFFQVPDDLRCAGTALCLTGAAAVRWVVYKSMDVSSIEEFTGASDA